MNIHYFYKNSIIRLLMVNLRAIIKVTKFANKVYIKTKEIAGPYYPMKLWPPQSPVQNKIVLNNEH
jgi:hypothetical protein